MLIYIDIVSGVEVCSDAYDQKEVEGFKGVRAVQSKKIVFKEVEANIGANASKGDGEEADGEDEGADAEEAVTVIDVVHAGKLQNLKEMGLDEKQFGKVQKAYWKRLIEALNKERYKALGITVSEEDDKETIKEKEAAATAELSKFEVKGVEDAKARMALFKAQFEDLQKFVKDVILANFAEFEFYMCEDGELGEAMIIPARYIGESEAPIFYFYDAGIKFQKA